MSLRQAENDVPQRDRTNTGNTTVLPKHVASLATSLEHSHWTRKHLPSQSTESMRIRGAYCGHDFECVPLASACQFHCFKNNMWHRKPTKTAAAAHCQGSNVLETKKKEKQYTTFSFRRQRTSHCVTQVVHFFFKRKKNKGSLEL